MNTKHLKSLLCAALIGSAALWGNSAQASLVTKYVPMLTYADHTVPTYEKPGGAQKGFISPNVSLILVKQVRPDGWAYGSYPIAGGKRVYRWFRMQELQGFSNFQNYTMKSDGTQTVYRTATSSAKVGSIMNKMDMLVVGETGDNLKIIYSTSGGSEYKMGWIEKPYGGGSYNGGNNNPPEEYGPNEQNGYGNSNTDTQPPGETGGYSGQNDGHGNLPNGPGGHRRGKRSGNSQIVYNYGTIVSNGDTDFSYNDNSQNDNSKNIDNSTDNSVNIDNSNNTTYDESRNDNRVTNDNHVDNSTNVDNSENSNTTNVTKNTTVNKNE